MSRNSALIRFLRALKGLFVGVSGVSGSFGPIITYSPQFTNVICPACGKSFQYLIGDVNLNEPLPWSNKSCPYCKWDFDARFYDSIKDKYLIFELKNISVSKRHYKDFKKIKRKRKTEHQPEALLSIDRELLNKYVAEGLATSRQPTLDELKDGKVWGVWKDWQDGPSMQRA